MSKTLTGFCIEQQEKLRLFEVWWIEKNKEDQNAYPMTMIDGNEGIWKELIDDFDISLVRRPSK